MIWARSGDPASFAAFLKKDRQDAELLIKIGEERRSIAEVGVPHYARTAGSPTGAKPSVIWRAVKDFWLLRLRLWANADRARRRGRPILGD